MHSNRRQVFAALLAAAATRQAIGADSTAIPGKRPMILHNDRPEDLETPVEYFDNWVTPVDAFFVRQHLPRPAPIDPATYLLNVTGLVSKPRQVSLDQLRKLPQHTLPRRSNAPATVAPSTLRNCPAFSGGAAPWATPNGAALASAMC